MAVKGALWLAKCYPSTITEYFLTGFRYLAHQLANQFSSPGWVETFPDPAVDSGGPVVLILDIGSEVRGFKPGRGRWTFSERKNLDDFLRTVGPVS